jgi:hypothetical protein
MTRLKPLHRLLHSLEIFVIEEVSTEGTATLHQLWRGVIMNTLATFSVNALVVRAKEGRVDHPSTKFIWVFKTDPLTGFFFT